MPSRAGLGLVLLIAFVTTIAASAAAGGKPQLHDPQVQECTIRHDAAIGEDLLKIRLHALSKDQRLVQKISDEKGSDVPLETSIALLFLSSGARSSAVVDGADSAKLNKKGNATLEASFNSFGTYEVDGKLKAKGARPASFSFKFSVTNTNGGACNIVG